MFNVQDYSLKIEPYYYQLKVRGRYEIITDTPLNTKALFAKYRLPNQEINKIYLIKSDSKCTTKIKNPTCQVYEATSYINQAGDAYFKREIKNYESMPLTITFDIDTTNGYTAPNLIDEINRYSIDTSFNYKNSFQVSREWYESTYQTLKIPTNITINKGNAKYEYQNITFSLPKDRVSFGIKHIPQLKVENLNATIDNKEVKLKERSFNGWQNYYTSSNANKGTLNSKFLLFLKNQAISINLTNSFTRSNEPNEATEFTIKSIINEDPTRHSNNYIDL